MSAGFCVLFYMTSDQGEQRVARAVRIIKDVLAKLSAKEPIPVKNLLLPQGHPILEATLDLSQVPLQMRACADKLQMRIQCSPLLSKLAMGGLNC